LGRTILIREKYNHYYGKEMNEMKKTDLSKIDFGSLIAPVIMGVGAFVGAVMDNKKNQKIDELIEKIDNLENNKES
jgi:hypothetical protein